MEGGFRVPAMIRWPGNVPAGKVENGIFSGLDCSRPSSPRPATQHSLTSSSRGSCSGHDLKVHLDGYNQMDVLTGKGPQSGTRSSTSPKRRSGPSASTTINTASSISRKAGWADGEGRLANPGQFCGSIPSSVLD